MQGDGPDYEVPLFESDLIIDVTSTRAICESGLRKTVLDSTPSAGMY